MAASPGPNWRTRVKDVLPEFAIEPARRIADMLNSIEISWYTRAWSRRDMNRYLRWQHSRNRSYSQQQLKSKIIKTYHGLEKGLSLGAPREGFGKGVATILKTQIADYRNSYGIDSFLVAPVRVLQEYLDFQTRGGQSLPMLTAFVAEIAPLLENLPPEAACERGGTEPTSADAIKAAGAVPFLPFLEARHSVRNFSGAPVASELLAQACRMAQLAPSACNRQGGRAHCFNEPALVQKIITMQPGNRGFGTSAGAVIVVTGDIRSYADAGERRQALVDASLFAMTLVYALHALGLGSCMLAWCVAPDADDAMRAAAGLHDAEEIAMLIAVGHLPETLNVPVSTRYKPGEVAMLNLAPMPDADPA
jgi:nitroreductase